MRHPAKRLFAAALALCLFAGGYARAEQIDWTYNWTPSATKITADAPNAAGSYLTLSNQASGSTTGDSFIVASNINTVSDAPPSNPATFSNAGYSLTLAITDAKAQAGGDPNPTGSLTFGGQFNGILSSKSAIIMNDFMGSTTQSVAIGDHLYTVKIGPFAPPGPPTAQNSGSISALASVTVTELPEPSTLMLSALCLGLFGAGWWWKRGRQVALNLA
ncbi:MAG TPA: PEP-CTERM sorting domain-containing protein [Gemmataceae bacterium]|nr:PEP-CTERM sorting domain-containing protein [Gemmataceae bacterium]